MAIAHRSERKTLI